MDWKTQFVQFRVDTKITFQDVTCIGCGKENITGIRCEFVDCTRAWCKVCMQESSKKGEPPKLTFFVMPIPNLVALICDPCRADLKDRMKKEKEENAE